MCGLRALCEWQRMCSLTGVLFYREIFLTVIIVLHLNFRKAEMKAVVNVACVGEGPPLMFLVGGTSECKECESRFSKRVKIRF